MDPVRRARILAHYYLDNPHCLDCGCCIHAEEIFDALNGKEIDVSSALWYLNGQGFKDPTTGEAYGPN